jgi:hypothetical protein
LWSDKLKGQFKSMNMAMASAPYIVSKALVRRIRYRRGFPFIMSAVLAVVTTTWPYVFAATSIWTFALLALISTAFALICGGQFRSFFITIAVTPPFLFFFGWFLRRSFAIKDFPSRAVSEYFLYFVAAPILLVWIVAALLNRNKRSA